MEMGRLSEELKNGSEVWEPEDLYISIKSATDADEAKGMVFVKYYKALCLSMCPFWTVSI